MSIERIVSIVVPRKRVEEGLNRLSSMSTFSSSFDDQLRNWEFIYGRKHKVENGKLKHYRSLFSVEAYLAEMDTENDIYSTINFTHPQRNTHHRISLAYHQIAQGFYQPQLDLAIFSVSCSQYNTYEDAASNLFLPGIRPAFFRLLEALDPIYGWRSTAEDALGWQEFFEPKDKLYVHFPMIIGRKLVPFFGLERLRQFEPFAKFELAGSIFVYAHHEMFYKIGEKGMWWELADLCDTTPETTPSMLSDDSFFRKHKADFKQMKDYFYELPKGFDVNLIE